MADATGSKLCTTDDVDRLQQTFLFTSTLQDRGLLAGGHLVELCDNSGTLLCCRTNQAEAGVRSRQDVGRRLF
jgi:hypothetical protein